jgi:DNA-binding GntR family transcriptional regulator
MEGYEHDELLAAILSGDAERAEACMRDHVLSTARGIVSFLEERKADGTGRQPDLVHE